jgi:hypothetical protein
MVEAVENSLQSSENSLQCNENSLQITENEELHVAAEKKQRGRPKGSTDKTPRKRTVIREEPVTPVKVEPVPAVTDVPPAIAAIAAVTKKKRRTNIGTEPILPESEAVTMDRMRLVQNIISERPPLSPRTLLRQAGETIYALQNQRDTARREFWAQQVAKSVR